MSLDTIGGDACYFFALDGSCAQCPFSHDRQTRRSERASDDPPTEPEDVLDLTEDDNVLLVEQRPCIFWKKGHCNKGKQCASVHMDHRDTKLNSSDQQTSISISNLETEASEITQGEQPNLQSKVFETHNSCNDRYENLVHGRSTCQGNILLANETLNDTEHPSSAVPHTAEMETVNENEYAKQTITPIEAQLSGDSDDHGHSWTCQEQTLDGTATAENISPVNHIEEGDRRRERVTLYGEDSRFQEGQSECQEEQEDVEPFSIRPTDERREHSDANASSQDQGENGVWASCQPNGTSNDPVPHWTEFADPHANPLVVFCKFFARGWCKQGLNCNYRHALTVQEYLLLFRVEPVFWSYYGQNENDNTPSLLQAPASFAHCKFFPLGKCRNGDLCPYSHTNVPVNAPDPGPDEQEQNDWAIAHEDYQLDRRQRPCKYFVNYGSCRRGEDCLFGHNKEDLNPTLACDVRGDEQASWNADKEDPHAALANDVECQEPDWNSWHQGEAQDWGVDDESFSKERRGETGLRDEDHGTETNAGSDQKSGDNGWGGNEQDGTSMSLGTTDNGGSDRSWIGFRQSGQIGDRTCRGFLRGNCRRAECKFLHQIDNSDPGAQGNVDNIPNDGAWTNSPREHQKAWQIEDRKSVTPMQEASGNELAGGGMDIDRKSHTNGRPKTCNDFSHGRCFRSVCKFSHVADQPANNGPGSSDSPLDTWHISQAQNLEGWHDMSSDKPSPDPNKASWDDNWLKENVTSEAANAPSGRRPEPCKYFGQGFCKMGDACRMLHLQPDGSVELGSQESHKKNAEDQGPYYVTDAQTERSIFNSTVAFGAGCHVLHMLTATDPNEIALSNLPPDFSPEDLQNFEAPVDGLREVHIEESNAVSDATLGFETKHHALQAVRLLDGHSLRNSTLSARPNAAHILAVSNGTEKVAPWHHVRIKWPAPSKIAWVRYPSITVAKEDASRIDGQFFEGRKVKASYTPAKKGQTSMFAVRLSNLPVGSNETSIRQRCTGCQFVNLTKPTYVLSPIGRIVDLLNKTGNLVEFHTPDLPPGEETLIAFAKFERPEEVAATIAALHMFKVDFLGPEGFLTVEGIHHARFGVASDRFQLIEEDLEKLRDSYHQNCSILVARSVAEVDIYAHALINNASAFVRLFASLVLLVYGEVLQQDGSVVWDDYFSMPCSTKAIDAINAENIRQYNVLIVPDGRTQRIHILGAELNRPRAKDSVLKLLRKVRAAWKEVPFERIFVRWYLEQGRGQIQSDSDIGQNNVTVDLTVPKLIVRGDLRILNKVKECMLNAVAISKDCEVDGACHACLHKPIAPVRLICRHSYCKECLVTLLEFAVEDVCMPLKCIATDVGTKGDKIPCNKDIPYPVVRDHLRAADEEKLLRSRLMSHVRSGAEGLFFCPTPNCETVHRYSERDVVFRCRTCMNDICASCRTIFHAGATCEAWRDMGRGI